MAEWLRCFMFTVLYSFGYTKFVSIDFFLEYENELTMNRTSITWKKAYPACRAFCEKLFEQSTPELRMALKYVEKSSRCECFQTEILFQPEDGLTIPIGFYSVPGNALAIMI